MSFQFDEILTPVEAKSPSIDGDVTVWEALTVLEMTIGNLDRAISGLIEKIEPFRSMDGPTPDNAKGESRPGDIGAPAVRNLRQAVAALTDQYDRVRKVTSEIR